jgi:DNA-binding response OmpR family regulator
VIFLTGLKEEGDRQLAGTAGADGYLTKPFQLSHVAEEVSRALSIEGG